jgi:hypothetical protein
MVVPLVNTLCASSRPRPRTSQGSRAERGGYLHCSHSPTQRTKDIIVSNNTTASFASLFSATVVTIAMLACINGLATSQPTSAQVANAAVAAVKA